jgi:hypothetical protein
LRAHPGATGRIEQLAETIGARNVTIGTISRRDLNLASLSLLAAAAARAFGAANRGTAGARASTRRKVIQQVLPGDPPRELVLVEVNYPPRNGLTISPAF